MSAKVFIGNLSSNTTEGTLREAFMYFGEVIESSIARDRDTGKSRGFGFVTFDSDRAAEAAIGRMDGEELDGHQLKVNSANAKGGNRGGGYSYGNYSSANFEK